MPAPSLTARPSRVALGSDAKSDSEGTADMERFGKYELRRRIGSGGMAEVYQARTFGAEGFEKDVVIKRILPAFSEDPDFVHMFINEARLAVKLQHANIVQIFDFNHVDGIYFIAMEWVNGVDLKKVINTSRRRAQPVPLRFVIHVGVETLKGLHHAHSKLEAGVPLQLVHRDISPHNLLVSYAGEVKITDFGIAKATAIVSGTRGGAVKGKLAYMSPEQALVRPLDARSDLFSLGVVLWELLTNRRIYQASSEPELLALVKAAEISSPGAHRDEVPQDLEAVIMRLLARDPAQRYSSAEEALNHLHRLGDVGDALLAADYMRRLLPESAAQEGKGETLVLPPRGGADYRTAGPEVQTRTTVDASGDTIALIRPQVAALSPSSAAVKDSRRSALPTGPEPQEEPSEQYSWPQRDLRPLVVGAFCFLICGICGYWVAGRASLAPAPERAQLSVQSQPGGVRIWIDGIEMGTTPLEIEAPSGRSLRLEAQLGPRRRWAQELSLRPHQRLQVTLPDEDTAAQGNLAQGKRLTTASGGLVSAQASSPTSPSGSPGERSNTPLSLAQPPIRPSQKALAPSASPPLSSSGAGVPVPAVQARPRWDHGQVAAPPFRKLPRPSQGRAQPSRRPQVQGWGLLEVFIAPWANVQLDGQDLGQTPLRRRRIKAGVHRLTIFNSALSKKERLRIKVIPGKTITIRRNWEDGP